MYQELKALPGGERAMVGIVHNVLKFKPLLGCDPIAYFLTNLFTPITNTLVMDFFRTGRFHYSVMGFNVVNYQDDRAQNANDFVGLNFYANPVIGPNRTNIYGPTCRTGQEMGEMFLPIDPEGFADAIDEVATLGKPIFVTETGIADRNDRLRQKLLPSYLDVIKAKKAKGADVRAVYFWTPFDNYEWNQGNTKSFGFFDAQRRPRESVALLKQFIDAENVAPSVESHVI